jgi:hypothetical protein
LNTATSDKGDGAVYLAFVEGELATERERRASFEARGVTIVTTSGGLLTLLAGAGALIGGEKMPQPPTFGIVALVLSLIFFAMAAAFGLLVNLSVVFPRYQIAHVDTMRKMRVEKWADTASDSRSVVAHIHILTIESLRKANTQRALLLSVGQGLQLLAVIGIGVVVCSVLLFGN